MNFNEMFPLGEATTSVSAANTARDKKMHAAAINLFNSMKKILGNEDSKIMCTNDTITFSQKTTSVFSVAAP
jgi:hypothetical protein